MSRRTVFGDEVRGYRQRLGLTQEDLARKAGIDPKTIRGVEAGHRKPRPSTVRQLADAFGLVGGERDRFYTIAVSATRHDVATRAAEADAGVPGQLPADLAGFTGRRRELGLLDRLLADVPTDGARPLVNTSREQLADLVAVDGAQPITLDRPSAGEAAALPSAPAAVEAPATIGSPASPVQLPANVRGFAGRVDQLTALDRILDAAGTHPTAVVISAVSGTAGVGKTALAVHWAHRVADRFPDGQLYINLRGFDPGGKVLAPAQAVRGFLHALGVPGQRIPADPDAQVGLYRSLLAGKRILVVLDNARDADQVRPLLPGTPTAVVVVTSRNQLTGLVAAEGAHPITVNLLSTVEARELLARRLGADRVTGEPDAVDRIIAACARLPLALTIAAARAQQTGFPLATIASELADTGRRLDTLDAGDPTSQVRAVFAWSYDALTPAAARLFRLLGLHPGPDTSAPAAASLTALPLSQARAPLAELSRANLLVEHTPGRHTLHDLLRTYATELAHSVDPEPQRRDATHRLLDHDLHTGHTAALLLHPGRDPLPLNPPQPGVTPERLADHQKALDWFSAEHPVLLAAVHHAAATGFDTHTWQLAWTLAVFLDGQGHWQDWAAVQRAAVTAAERSADPAAQALGHRLLASAYTRLGRFDDALNHLQQALDLGLRVGDRTKQAHTHSSLAFLYGEEGRYADSLRHAEQALSLYRATGHRGGEAQALCSVGNCHAHLGDHQRALTYCRQAVTLSQELGIRHDEAVAWDNLGYAHHQLGHHTQAITCYQRALDLYRENGHRYYEAGTLTHLGNTHHAAGNRTAASAAWQHALDILTDLDHPDADTVRTKLDTIDQHSP